MNKKTIRFNVCMALMTTFAFSQTQIEKPKQLDEVVVSDTKFEQNKEKSGKVITKITQADLQKKVGFTVAQVLSSVAGVEINGNQSAAGKNLGIYVRGGRTNQVLVLIDGIPISDASGISLEYDLRLLAVEQVESIEILKGASSTLYGTGAAAGVINIILKKGVSKPIQALATLSVGSNNTSDNMKFNGQDVSQGLAVSGSQKKFNYLASANRSEISGMSQIAAVSPNQNFENDRFSRQNYVAKLGLNATKNIILDFFGNYDKIQNDYDFAFDNTGFNDTNLNKSSSEQFRFGFSPKVNYKNGNFVLNSSFNKIIRKYDDFNSFSNALEFSEYESRNVNLDGINKYKFNKNFSLITGINFQFHDMATQTPYDNLTKEATKFNLLDPYFTGVYSSDFGLNLNFGGRMNAHSQYGNAFVYNINPSFNLKSDANSIKFLSSYSTAFITPSLYQLYSQYGNDKLTPEKNATIETGFEGAFLNKKLSISAVGFYREQQNSIGFYFNPITFAGNYVNIEGVNKAKGVETEISYSCSKKVQLQANYTFTQVDDAINRLVPKHKINAAIHFEASSRVMISTNFQYLDKRNDAFFDGNTFEAATTSLAAYRLVDFILRYQVIKNRMNIFANATNIFNENYIENIGYSTRGRNFKVGLSINL